MLQEAYDFVMWPYMDNPSHSIYGHITNDAKVGVKHQQINKWLYPTGFILVKSLIFLKFTYQR